jgi:Ca2+-binding EF-hand superfamily protein
MAFVSFLLTNVMTSTLVSGQEGNHLMQLSQVLLANTESCVGMDCTLSEAKDFGEAKLETRARHDYAQPSGATVQTDVSTTSSSAVDSLAGQQDLASPALQIDSQEAIQDAAKKLLVKTNSSEDPEVTDATRSRLMEIFRGMDTDKSGQLEPEEVYNNVLRTSNGTPEPSASASAPEPTSIEGAPEPTAIAGTPVANFIEGTPEATAIASTPEPTSIDGAPEPFAIASTQDPTLADSTAEPAAVSAAIASTPEPTSSDGAPEPFAIASTSDPTLAGSTPEPAAVSAARQFVDRMFLLDDEDESGTISFDEFVASQLAGVTSTVDEDDESTEDSNAASLVQDPFYHPAVNATALLIQHWNNAHSVADEHLSGLSAARRRKNKKQKKWASEQMTKSEKPICMRDYYYVSFSGKWRQSRGMSWSWSGPHCSGWNQIGLICYRPCTDQFGSGWHGVGAMCYPGCKSGYTNSRLGECAERCGEAQNLDFVPKECDGWIYCAEDSARCWKKFAEIAFNFASLAASLIPYAGTASKAIRVARAAGKGLKAAVVSAVRAVAKKMLKKAKTNLKKYIKKRVKQLKKSLREEAEDAILNGGAEELGSAMVLQEFPQKDVEAELLAVADAVDPIGIVAVIQSFIEDGCDKLKVSEMPAEGLEDETEEQFCGECDCQHNSGGWWGSYWGCDWTPHSLGRRYLSYCRMGSDGEAIYRGHSCPVARECAQCCCQSNVGGYWGRYDQCTFQDHSSCWRFREYCREEGAGTNVATYKGHNCR